jgi:hypothetical protein
MFKKNVLWIMTIVSLLVAACSSNAAGFVLPNTGQSEQNQPTDAIRGTPDRPQPVVSSFEELVTGLEAAGAEVEVVGDFDQPLPFLDVTVHILRVNGADVQVGEFNNEESRRRAESVLQDRASSVQDVLPDWIKQANIWSNGRLIVFYSGVDAEIIRLISSLLGEPLVIANEQSDASQPAMELVRQILQSMGGILQRVDFLSIERREWPDACLGIARGDEACAEVVTPGFLIIVEIDGQRFTFHSDETGQIIRMEQ